MTKQATMVATTGSRLAPSFIKVDFLLRVSDLHRPNFTTSQPVKQYIVISLPQAYLQAHCQTLQEWKTPWLKPALIGKTRFSSPNN